ncbi:hypothetical protein SK30_26095 [Bacillus cereus]|nr:hypothetical protein SK30_26095 [Bacillus cereus]
MYRGRYGIINIKFVFSIVYNLIDALAFTGIVGTSIIDMPKVEATSASVTAQQTSSRLVDGLTYPSSKINGAGQYGRITLQCDSIYLEWKNLTFKR